MSRRRPTATAIAALAALVAAPAIPAASLEQIVERGYIRVGVANQRPFGAMTSAGTAEGFGPSIAKKVLDRMGITRIVWKVVPPDALIASLQGERVDAVAAALTITPKRCSKVAFSQPNTSFGQAMLVRTPNPQDIHGYPDFQTRAGLKLGVVASSQPALLARKLAIADDQLVVLPGAGAAPAALAAGRIDAYADSQLGVTRLARGSARVSPARPFHDPVVAGRAIRRWGAYAFNKQATALRAAFNENLAAVQARPIWRNTLKRFGLDDHAIDQVSARSTEQLCRRP